MMKIKCFVYLGLNCSGEESIKLISEVLIHAFIQEELVDEKQVGD